VTGLRSSLYVAKGTTKSTMSTSRISGGERKGGIRVAILLAEASRCRDLGAESSGNRRKKSPLPRMIGEKIHVSRCEKEEEFPFLLYERGKSSDEPLRKKRCLMHDQFSEAKVRMTRTPQAVMRG